MKRTILTLLLLAAALPAVRPASAQQDVEAARRALQGRGVTETEILERLRASGMSREEIKRRLAQAGYDPALVDTYMDVIEGGRSTRPLTAPEDFLFALEEIGVTREGIPMSVDDALQRDRVGDGSRYDRGDFESPWSYRSMLPEVDSVRIAGQPIFGRSLFRRRTTEFETSAAGPVPPDYRLGPGDQLVAILSGAAQTAYTMEVMRDGSVVVPDAGPIPVNGLTLAEAEAVLLGRLGRVYSGLGRTEGSTTRLSLSVGQIRSNQVVVAGDVERPGSYTITSLGTAFTALYRAGGPNAIGSFRQVQVRRNGRLVSTLDLYDYLVAGDGSSDVRLEQGDFVFVPVAGPRVVIEGAVRRPAAYELEAHEGLRELLRFAGGLEADAVVRRIQIDRILPPSERRPGVDRVVLDADLTTLFGEGASRIPLADGDIVRVFAVSEARRNLVAITGAVNREGTYQWTPGMTVAELVDWADGLGEQALSTRSHVYRLDPATGQRTLVPIQLVSGGEVSRVTLEDRDSVVVLSQGELAIQDSVTIRGFVKEPGTYSLAPGMTVQDLILQAGGYRTGADTAEAEVARVPTFSSRTDTVARVFSVATGSAYGEDGGDFELAASDQLFVRKAPGYEPLQTVVVTGEVLTPSEYVLGSRTTRITDVIRRAGGLTGEASIRGVQLFRGGDLVAVDLDRAQAAPGSRHDFTLEPGDSLHVPKFDPTVLVVGKGVAFETRVPYRPGAGLSYYIAQSGGYTETADRDRVSVTYQNGQRAISDHLLLFRRSPTPRAGSTVVVPEVPPAELSPFNMTGFASTTLGLLSSLATLLVLLNQL